MISVGTGLMTRRQGDPMMESQQEVSAAGLLLQVERLVEPLTTYHDVPVITWADPGLRLAGRPKELEEFVLDVVEQTLGQVKRFSKQHPHLKVSLEPRDLGVLLEVALYSRQGADKPGPRTPLSARRVLLPEG